MIAHMYYDCQAVIIHFKMWNCAAKINLSENLMKHITLEGMLILFILKQFLCTLNVRC